MKHLALLVVVSGCVGSAQVTPAAPPPPPYTGSPFTSCVVDSEQYLVQQDVQLASERIGACPSYIVLPQRVFYEDLTTNEVDRLATFDGADCFYKKDYDRFGDIDCKLAAQQSPAVAPNN
jgi:hypothetical protein